MATPGSESLCLKSNFPEVTKKSPVSYCIWLIHTPIPKLFVVAEEKQSLMRHVDPVLELEMAWASWEVDRCRVGWREFPTRKIRLWLLNGQRNKCDSCLLGLHQLTQWMGKFLVFISYDNLHIRSYSLKAWCNFPLMHSCLMSFSEVDFWWSGVFFGY